MKKNKKKKKGFTLIELLAVILILGIIALIAIPTVNGVIDESRKGAYSNTVLNVVKAINQYIISSSISGDDDLKGVYQISEFKDKLDIKNISDLDGWVEIDDGQVVSYSFSNDKYISYGNLNLENTLGISDLETSKLSTLNLPFTNDYKSDIVNVYLTYGTLPNNYVESGYMSSDNKIIAYLLKNGEDSNKYDLFIVSENKIVAPSSLSNMFANYYSLKNIEFDNFDTSSVTNFGSMFKNDYNLLRLDLSSFDTSNAISMASMFLCTIGLEYLDVSSFDTSKVTNMSSMFAGGAPLDDNNWQYTNSSLIYVGIENFDLSSVTNMSRMFYRCGLSSLNLSSWKISGDVNLKEMFRSTRLENIDISNFDTSSVTNATDMFIYDGGLKNIYVGSKWTNISFTYSASMFQGCSKLPGYTTSDYSSNKATTDGYLTLKN